jgi:hypothetical protein
MGKIDYIDNKMRFDESVIITLYFKLTVKLKKSNKIKKSKDIKNEEQTKLYNTNHWKCGIKKIGQLINHCMKKMNA